MSGLATERTNSAHSVSLERCSPQGTKSLDDMRPQLTMQLTSIVLVRHCAATRNTHSSPVLSLDSASEGANASFCGDVQFSNCSSDGTFLASQARTAVNGLIYETKTTEVRGRKIEARSVWLRAMCLPVPDPVPVPLCCVFSLFRRARLCQARTRVHNNASKRGGLVAI